jgi:hypothetical protein
MFVTLPQFEQPMPLSLVQSGSRYWRALELSLSVPWFIVAIRQQDAGFAVLRNIFLSTDADLRAFLESDLAANVVSLGVLVPPNYGHKRQWKLQSIRRVWERDPARSSPHDSLVIEIKEGRYFDAMTMLKPKLDVELQLLLELPVG